MKPPEGQSRAAIIASWVYGKMAATSPTPAKGPAEADPEEEQKTDQVTPEQIKQSIETAISLQERDPDGDTDPNDAKVLTALQDALKAQEADEAGETEMPAKPAPEKPTPPAVTAASVAGPDSVPGATEHDAVEDEDQNQPPAVEGSDAMGPEFSGVLIIEGQPTGDGREIAPNALSWRDPPMPLMGLRTETHDPTGMDMNDPAVICGRIDTLERQAGEGDTQLILYKGHFLNNDDGLYFADLAEQMGRLGVSGDVAVSESEVTINEIDDMGYPMDISELLTEGTIMGCTACPFPAFHGAYLVLGPDAKPETGPEVQAIPQAVEEPAIVASGGQLIHYMSYTECEACDQGFEVIVASGAGPTRPPKAWFADPQFELGDGRLVEVYGRNGQREGKYACPITVTEEGRVYGHLAPWGTCHTGKPGQCVTAPHSGSGYAHFMRGQHILTAEGERVNVGVITADTGHAPLAFRASAAMAHYDDTALSLADVAAGEDEYGIWIAGAVRPDATEGQIRKLTASSLSGDWREIGGELEMVAALCVPIPGFPLAVVEQAFVASGHVTAITAAGANVMARLKVEPSEQDPAALLTLAAPALNRLVRRDARERIAALG